LPNIIKFWSVAILAIEVNLTVLFFLFRLNALDYRELKDKLQTTVRNARNIVIRQTLSEQFLQAFAEQVTVNLPFHPPPEMVGLKYYNFDTNKVV